MEILCYTREPKEDIIYANRLAYSMHLAWKDENGKFIPFHHNEGLLYAKAVSREDGTLTAKSLKKPWIFACGDGTYGVVAIRTEAEGEADMESEGCILIFKSEDFVHYQEIGLLRLQKSGFIEEVQCVFDKHTGKYLISWTGTDGIWKQVSGNPFVETELYMDEEKCAKQEAESNVVQNSSDWDTIEGICPGNQIEVPDKLGDYLIKKLMLPKCVEICAVLEDRKISSDILVPEEKLQSVKAKAIYSDGTEAIRKIDWEKKENGEVNGRVHQEHFPFPFTENRADPCCMYWKGKYYFIATNDADDNHTLYMRCADTLEGIIDAEEKLILDSETYPGIGGLLWAPEFHEIAGKMYIFHAATEGEFFREESRVMKLRDGGDPMCREDWSAPMLVVKKDGTPLCDAGNVISLDMTTFEYEGNIYAMWSQRQFLPVDQGAWLYLAQIDEKEPWKLVSDPICIVKPEYGWENNHTFVVEGPYALRYHDQLYITYSGAAVDATYAVGLLKPIMGSDILKPENWQRSNYPLLSSRSKEGEFGPGHNSYVTDENGLVWNFYHARPGVDGPRSSAARRVHFDIDGELVLDLLEEYDLPEAMRQITVKIR